ncbi:MAG: hypothetical protein JNK42_04860 [Caedimonas sp.]|jgi:sulfur-carrier protein adenylyltransferase/sulfurtransferase|nr:hypothetical protein [Caedimonas sp.]
MTNSIPSFATGEISVEEYFNFFHRQEPHFFLDVREPWELDIARIEGARHIPLGSLENRWDELPQDEWIICYCHHGVRSLRACHLLKEKGFAKVVSLRGGIHRWAEEADKTMPTY